MFECTQVRADGPHALSRRTESVLALFEFTVAPANNQLAVSRGWFAAMATDPGRPVARPASLAGTGFVLSGSAGLGALTFNHAKLQWTHKAGFVNEHAVMWFAEFDTTRPPAEWLDESEWAASFEHPLLTRTRQDRVDLGRYQFHRLGLTQGWTPRLKTTLVKDRYAHHVGTEDGPAGGTDTLTVVAPFVQPSLTCALLRSAGFDSTPGYMPATTVEVAYGQEQPADRLWSHFPGEVGAIPHVVAGYALVATGGFTAIPTAELPDWFMPAADGWTAAKVFRRVVALASRYPAFRRTLDTVGDHAQTAVVVPPAGNLPVEVLHLRGLASPAPVL